MSADTLTVSSRSFYERTKGKLVASIIIGAGSMVTLGLCASNGGLSQSNDILAGTTSGDQEDSYNALAQGYGFASFFDILACILLVAAALYVSPMIAGSPNEKKIIRNPQELDNSYSAYEENPAKNSGTNSQV